MMNINKFIKNTSLFVLGAWMFLGSASNAFAANETVESEVDATIKSLMVKDTNGNFAQKLKNEELVNIRNDLAKKVNELENEYFQNMENIKSYQKKLETLANEVKEVEKELNAFDKLGIVSGVLIATGAVLLAVGTGGVGPIVLGLAGAVVAWMGSNAVNDPESLRSWVNGSYTWATQQLIDKTIPIDTSEISKIDLSKIKDASQKAKAQQAINKALKVISEYNSIASELSAIGKKALNKAMELDQAVEEFHSINPTLTAGQELYVYYVFAGKDPDTGEDTYISYYFILEGGKLESITGVTRGCVPLPAKLAEAKSCIYCPLFKTIFNAAQSMSTKSYSALATPLANVLLIGFALVIAFMVLKNVSSFTKQDAPKFITELLVNMFKVLIAFYMLKNSDIVYGYIIGPVLKAGFEFGTSLLFATKDNYLETCAAMKLPENTLAGVMPAYLYNHLDCFIKAVQAEVAVPQSIGSSLMCVSRNAGKVSIGPLRNIMWDFGMMFQGLAIWIMGWIISLAFAFYLIDATIQLGIIGALMPFLIACWPFKTTRQYTSKGWGMFMNTFFVYVFMGLVVSINVELLGQGLTGSSGGFDAIQAALNGNEVSKLKELLDIGFAGFLVLVACCLFAFKLTGQASSLAGTMAGGGGPNIGANIGGLAYGAATKGVQGTLKTGLGAAKGISDKTGLTSIYHKGKDAVLDGALGMVGLGRKSGSAGNKAAQNSFANSKQNTAGSAATTAENSVSTPLPQSGRATNNPVAQNQVKKMSQLGSRAQAPAKPEAGVPDSRAAQNVQNNSVGNKDNIQNPQKPKDVNNTSQAPQDVNSASQDMQKLRQQLEADYQNTANGKAGQKMIENQTADLKQKQKTENDAFNKMNYHNRRANEYLQKSQKATDPAQKKNFENLANAQFDEAVKAEATYNKAKGETIKSQNELNNIKQENERYKNEFVQNELNKRSAQSPKK